MLVVDDLLRIPRQEGKVEQKSQPVSVDKEEEGKDSVYGCFRDNIRVEPVTKVDWIDVVTTATVSLKYSTRCSILNKDGAETTSVCFDTTKVRFRIDG